MDQDPPRCTSVVLITSLRGCVSKYSHTGGAEVWASSRDPGGHMPGHSREAVSGATGPLPVPEVGTSQDVAEASAGAAALSGLGPQPCSGQPPAAGRGPSRARPETRCSPGWSFPPAPSSPAARPFTEVPGRGPEGPGSLSGASDGRRGQSCPAGRSVMRDQPIRGLGIGSGCTPHWREGVLWQFLAHFFFLLTHRPQNSETIPSKD